MNKKMIIVTILTAIILIIISSNISFAGITPDQLTGDDSVELDTDFIDKLTEFIRIAGMFIAVGALMVIGIKYVTGSIEEKANYKKSMMPYIIGCFVLFGAAFLEPVIKELFDNMGSDTEEIGNNILGIIQIIGTLVTFGVLMILGIKYMMGSVEEKAEYKKSMLPYIIGVVLLFGAVNITAAIYDVVIEAGKTDEERDEDELNERYNAGYTRGYEIGYGLTDQVQYSRYRARYMDIKNHASNEKSKKYYEGLIAGLHEGFFEKEGVQFVQPD